MRLPYLLLSLSISLRPGDDHTGTSWDNHTWTSWGDHTETSWDDHTETSWGDLPGTSMGDHLGTSRDDFPRCPGRDHCSSMFDTVFSQRNCECDSACVYFGDCCVDYPWLRDSLGKDSSDRLLKCNVFDSGPAFIGTYVEVGCPAGAEPELKEKCEAEYNPVIVSPEGPTYLNEHCAVCNGHALDRLIRFSLNVDCEDPPPSLSSAYIRQNMKWIDGFWWEVEFESKSYLCQLIVHFTFPSLGSQFEPIDKRSKDFKFSNLFTLNNKSEVARRDPEYNKSSDSFKEFLAKKFGMKIGKRSDEETIPADEETIPEDEETIPEDELRMLLSVVRLCRPYLVSECPPEWRDEQIRKACGEYERVLYGPSKAYRNPHCALCNGQDVRSLVCDRSELDMGRRKEFSFAHLFDIFGEGDVGRLHHSCPENHQYDRVSMTCRKLVCAIPGRVLKNGRCARP